MDSDHFQIRAYRPEDLELLYQICLQTGDSGDDATGQIEPELLGHVYVGPYVTFEPELCFVLTHGDRPCGYILGTSDSHTFQQRCESDWYPRLRDVYPEPDDADVSFSSALVRSIHRGYQCPSFVDQYPAHLHIDIVPVGQGQGFGFDLMERFWEVLKKGGIAGLHLEVGLSNQRAVKWYRKIGYHSVRRTERTEVFGVLFK